MNYLETLKDLFQGSGVIVTSDKEQTWVNFDNGETNCEFYPCGDTGYLTATYTVDGKEKTLDLHIEEDQYEIKRIVLKILGKK